MAPAKRTRLGVLVLVAVLHLAAILGLIRAFAPQFSQQAVDRVLSTFTVTITSPPPPPPPPPPSEPEPKAVGAQGAAGRQAVPTAAKAPQPKVPLAKAPAPRASSTGTAVTSGATDQGAGTGSGASGDGTGSGGSGSGQGSGGAAKAVHISGQISNARDFPVPPGGREARIGKSVILALTIAPSGRATACRVYRSSGFPETDARACTLAMARLRFKPATNDAGEPIASTFYWQQKFYF